MTSQQTFMLPGHLKQPGHILIDPSVLNQKVARRILSRLPNVPWSLYSDPEQQVRDIDPGGSYVLYLKHYKGRFLRFCPGTKHYQCCGYRIIHMGENCPLNCSYCILKAYFQDSVLKVWANQDDLFRELEQQFSPGSRLIRAGTGEFTDSLALESITGYSRDLAAFLSEYPGVCLELKSKIVDLTWMDRVSDPRRVLPAWSVNSPEIIRTQEQGTAPLENRLRAARTCADQGFRVCLHFDPIIHYPGWKQGYAKTVEIISDYLAPEEIAYLSLGSFRFMPQLEKIIIRKHPGASYVFNEFITGLDGKKRLLLPLRLEQFGFITDQLRKLGLDRQIYFCMESSYVWKKILGCTPKDLGGLDNHLLKLSFGL